MPQYTRGAGICQSKPRPNRVTPYNFDADAAAEDMLRRQAQTRAAAQAAAEAEKQRILEERMEAMRRENERIELERQRNELWESTFTHPQFGLNRHGVQQVMGEGLRPCRCRRPDIPYPCRCLRGGVGEERAEVQLQPRGRKPRASPDSYQLLDSTGQPTVGAPEQTYPDEPPRPAVMPPQMRSDQFYSDRKTITRNPVTITYAPLTTYQRGRGPTRF